MKKTISILLIVFALSLNTLSAQEKPNLERIEALKIAFITEKIALTEKQSQEFWPLYNAFQKEKNQLKENSKNSKTSLENMSDDEINKVIKDKFNRDEKLLQLEKTYFQKYQSVISMKQIALLYKSEKDFRKEVMERIRQRK